MLEKLHVLEKGSCFWLGVNIMCFQYFLDCKYNFCSFGSSLVWSHLFLAFDLCYDTAYVCIEEWIYIVLFDMHCNTYSQAARGHFGGQGRKRVESFSLLFNDHQMALTQDLTPIVENVMRWNPEMFKFRYTSSGIHWKKNRRLCNVRAPGCLTNNITVRYKNSLINLGVNNI